jgi:hypothetical protein
MVAPVRTAASWLAGRFLLLLLILAALVVHNGNRNEAKALWGQVRALFPGDTTVQDLEAARREFLSISTGRRAEVIESICATQAKGRQQIDARIREIDQMLAVRPSWDLTAPVVIAFANPEERTDYLRRVVENQMLEAERSALAGLRTTAVGQCGSLAGATRDFIRARAVFERARAQYASAKEARARIHERYPLTSLMPMSDAWAPAQRSRVQVEQALQSLRRATAAYLQAQKDLAGARARERLISEPFDAVTQEGLRSFDNELELRRKDLERAAGNWDRLQKSVREMFVAALLILVAVTLLPVLIRAFLYYVVAPAAARRPPIRLVNAAQTAVAPLPDEHFGRGAQSRISAVSLDLPLGVGEEMLVQPDFLQSSSDRARTDTKWVLNWQYPLTSIAARMVALTRIRVSSRQSFVISSKTDPLSEVGVIRLELGSAFTLQPRNLVGLVQRIDAPIRIESRWKLAKLSAWVTFQFRYLVFHGPGTLIVQGCRGVRLEDASISRSIDQASTIGFSANLDYSCRRTETFGAYLLGMRSLFNDNFRGAPGAYAYEEMPYLYKKTGITGRGFEGLVDGILKAFGI